MHRYGWLHPGPACLQKQRSLVALCLGGLWCTVVFFPVSSCTNKAYTSTALFAGDVKAFCAVQVFYIKLLSRLAGFPLAPSSWECSVASQSHYSTVYHKSAPPSQREPEKADAALQRLKRCCLTRNMERGSELLNLSLSHISSSRCTWNYPVCSTLGTKKKKSVWEEKRAGLNDFTWKYGS